MASRRCRPAPQRTGARELRHALDPSRARRGPRPRLGLRATEEGLKAPMAEGILQGQKVVVFGGGSGAGLAAAKLLLSKGAEVIVTGRSLDKMEAARKEG